MELSETQQDILKSSRERINTNGRTNRETTKSLQNELRSNNSSTTTAGNENSANGETNRTNIESFSGNGNIVRDDDRESRLDIPTSSKSNSSTSTGNARNSGTLQQGEWILDKPEGFVAIPSTNEQNERIELIEPIKQKRKYTKRIKDTVDNTVIETKNKLLPFIKTNKTKRTRPLTDTEANNLKPELTYALSAYFDIGDELIQATVKNHKPVRIWTSIDDEDIEVLVDAMLSRAKKSVTMASSVNNIVESYRGLRVGLILAPRFYQTFMLYMENGIGVK